MAHQVCQRCGYVEERDPVIASMASTKRVDYCDFQVGLWQRVYFLCDDCVKELIRVIVDFAGKGEASYANIDNTA